MLSQIIASLLQGAVLFLDVYSWLIVIHSALTIFTRPKYQGSSKAFMLLKRITEPINSPSRRLVKRLGGSGMPADISPMLSLTALWVMARILDRLAENFSRFPY